MAIPGLKASEHVLSSRQSTASDEDLQVYCQTCVQDGQKLPAHGYCTDCKEHLCRVCFKLHKKHKLSKHHTLLDATSKPRVLQDNSTINLTYQLDEMITPCVKHPKESIKFYCHCHEELLCSVCVTLKHSASPCKVNYIPDMSRGFINSKEFNDTVKVLKIITKKYKKITEDLKAMTLRSNSSLAEVLTDIKKFRKDLNQRLDELERQVVDEAMTMLQQNENSLKTVETACANSITSLLSSSDAMKQFNTFNQANKLFVQIKLANKMIAEMKNDILHLQSYEMNKYDFKTNEQISNLIGNLSAIGTIEHKSVQIKPKTFSNQGKICVKISKDKGDCQISGMILLASDILIIADQGNRSVKMIDTNRELVTDHLKLDCLPRDVTKVTSTEIAVTFPTEQEVLFLSTSTKMLTKQHYFGVEGDCHGISCYKDKLAVSFYSPPKLQILNLDGNVLATVRGKHILRNPLHVTSNRQSIFVSDWGMRTVTRLNWLGELISMYGGLDFPSGLAVTDDGTFFVCDNERNVIEEVAEDCSKGKVLLKELKSPYVVCWCAETRKLYYCSFTQSDKGVNFIQIYRLSKTH